jgi:hypothetical protein
VIAGEIALPKIFSVLICSTSPLVLPGGGGFVRVSSASLRFESPLDFQVLTI